MTLSSIAKQAIATGLLTRAQESVITTQMRSLLTDDDDYLALDQLIAAIESHRLIVESEHNADPKRYN